MKKLLTISLSVILIFVMSGCDIYYGYRPFDYGAATWVCENPSVWFVVNPRTSASDE